MSTNTIEFQDIVINATERVDPKSCEGVTYVGLEHLQSDTFKLLDTGTSEDVEGQKFVMKKGDVLFGRRRAYQRKVGIAPSDGIFSAHGMILRPNTEVITSDFLPFFIRSDAFMKEAIRQSEGSLSPTLNWSSICDIQFTLPSLDDQKVLSNLLWKLEELNDLYHERLVLYDELVKSRFIEMFEKSDIPNKPLIECCRFIDYRGKTPEKSESGIPLITAKNVKDNHFSWEPREYIPSDNYDSIMVRGIPEINDVLFTTEAPLGNVCRIPQIEGKFCIGQRIITLQSKGELIPEYLEQALLSDSFRSQMISRSSGSTVKGIRSAELEKIKIPVPDLESQNQFAIFVNHVDKSKLIILDRINKTKELQRSILNNHVRCADNY